MCGTYVISSLFLWKMGSTAAATKTHHHLLIPWHHIDAEYIIVCLTLQMASVMGNGDTGLSHTSASPSGDSPVLRLLWHQVCSPPGGESRHSIPTIPHLANGISTMTRLDVTAHAARSYICGLCRGNVLTLVKETGFISQPQYLCIRFGGGRWEGRGGGEWAIRFKTHLWQENPNMFYVLISFHFKTTSMLTTCTMM